jgi:hypothetical protein
MPKINVLPSTLALPHDQHFYRIIDSPDKIRGPFGPFSLEELRQHFSTLGLAPPDIQNFLDQISSSGNGSELEIPSR